MIFRIHDVFVLLGVALSAGGIFKVRGRAVVTARGFDVLRTNIVAGYAVDILMRAACR